jgi:hypothetical protein
MGTRASDSTLRRRPQLLSSTAILLQRGQDGDA